MSKIKLTTTDGTVTYPTDLQNLSYEECVNKLDLLSINSGFDDFKSERQGEDVLCRSYVDGSFELFEIVE